MPGTSIQPVRLYVHHKNPDWRRLKWTGLHGEEMYADFDPCPYRKLSAETKARQFAEEVLGHKF